MDLLARGSYCLFCTFRRCRGGYLGRTRSSRYHFPSGWEELDLPRLCFKCVMQVTPFTFHQEEAHWRTDLAWTVFIWLPQGQFPGTWVQSSQLFSDTKRQIINGPWCKLAKAKRNWNSLGFRSVKINGSNLKFTFVDIWGRWEGINCKAVLTLHFPWPWASPRAWDLKSLGRDVISDFHLCACRKENHIFSHKQLCDLNLHWKQTLSLFCH